MPTRLRSTRSCAWHREDWRITRWDLRRHIVQGIPLGLQFSVLSVGIIVMQGCVVKFDMLDGAMVSSAAQNGFGAANKVNTLMMTPLNALGAAMTSFTAQNLGAGRTDRVRKGTLQALIIMVVIAAIVVMAGLLSSIGGAYLRLFLSADKITAETIRYGNTLLYVDFSMYLVPRRHFRRTQLRAGHRPVGLCARRGRGGVGGAHRGVPAAAAGPSRAAR